MLLISIWEKKDICHTDELPSRRSCVGNLLTPIVILVEDLWCLRVARFECRLYSVLLNVARWEYLHTYAFTQIFCSTWWRAVVQNTNMTTYSFWEVVPIIVVTASLSTRMSFTCSKLTFFVNITLPLSSPTKEFYGARSSWKHLWYVLHRSENDVPTSEMKLANTETCIPVQLIMSKVTSDLDMAMIFDNS